VARTPSVASNSEGETRGELGKLDIIDGEATPLVFEDGEMLKWMLAGKILYCNVFHIQAFVTASRRAWSNRKWSLFRYMGTNMFVVEFTRQHDWDRLWEGSPWYVIKIA
jgi:hypothetical protein